MDEESVAKFSDKLELLQGKWAKHKDEESKVQQFCAWFTKNKVDVMCHSMLRPVREDAGLGCPPEAFYTNASESVNNVIKRKVDYKRSDLPQFILKLKELAI